MTRSLAASFRRLSDPVLNSAAIISLVAITIAAILVSAEGSFELIKDYLARSGGSGSFVYGFEPLQISLTARMAWRLSLQILGPMLLLLLGFALINALDLGRKIVACWSLVTAVALIWAQADTFFTGSQQCWIRYGRKVHGYVLEPTVDVPRNVYLVLILLTVALLLLFWQLRSSLVTFVNFTGGAILLLVMVLTGFHDGLLEIERGISLGWWTLGAYAMILLFAGYLSFERVRSAAWAR